MKIEELLQENRAAENLIDLKDLSKEFGAKNRTLLWATMCEKRAPLKMTQEIAQGHQNTTLKCNEMGIYGEPIRNNVGGISRSGN